MRPAWLIASCQRNVVLEFHSEKKQLNSSTCSGNGGISVQDNCLDEDMVSTIPCLCSTPLSLGQIVDNWLHT